MFVLEPLSKSCDRNERMGKVRHMWQSWRCFWTSVILHHWQHSRSPGLGVQSARCPYPAPGQKRSLLLGKPHWAHKMWFFPLREQWLRCSPGTGSVLPPPPGCCSEQPEISSAPEVLVFPLFQTLHIAPLHPVAPNPIYFHFKAISRSYILYPVVFCFFFSQRCTDFSLPMGLPKPNKTSVSPLRRAVSISRSSASCPCLLQFF